MSCKENIDRLNWVHTQRGFAPSAFPATSCHASTGLAGTPKSKKNKKKSFPASDFLFKTIV